ncbi:MAG TPA: response regulator transcription factor [Nocardioides sp.]|nr:response regulator transcription factor [Nocardioides sp.]
MGEGPLQVVPAFADDEEREALSRALRDHGCIVPAAAARVEEAVTLAADHRPHVVLLGDDLPGHGTAAAREITRRLPACAVVLMGESPADEDVIDALRAGATGYLPRDIAPERLVAALHGILAGEAAMPRRLVGRLLEEFRAPATQPFNRVSPAAAKLTVREWEVMALLGEGLPTDQVARRLFLSASTVRVHVSSSLRKLRVADRESAFALLRES